MEELPEMIKIIVYLNTNKVGSKVTKSFETEKADWESMSDEEKDELCKETMEEMIEWGWYES